MHTNPDEWHEGWADYMSHFIKAASRITVPHALYRTHDPGCSGVCLTPFPVPLPKGGPASSLHLNETQG